MFAAAGSMMRRDGARIYLGFPCIVALADADGVPRRGPPAGYQCWPEGKDARLSQFAGIARMINQRMDDRGLMR